MRRTRNAHIIHLNDHRTAVATRISFTAHKMCRWSHHNREYIMRGFFSLLLSWKPIGWVTDRKSIGRRLVETITRVEGWIHVLNATAKLLLLDQEHQPQHRPTEQVFLRRRPQETRFWSKSDPADPVTVPWHCGLVHSYVGMMGDRFQSGVWFVEMDSTIWCARLFYEFGGYD